MLVNTLRTPKSDQTCIQSNMLAVFLLTTANDRCWWNHCRSLGSPGTSSLFAKPFKKGAGGLTVPTNDLYCDWFKVVIAIEVIIFLAFCSLSLCCRKTCLSGTVFVVAQSESVHSLHPILGLGHCTRASSKSIHRASFCPPVKLTGSKVEGRLMQSGDFLRMELMSECMEKWPVLLIQESTWSPSSPTILPQQHFMLLKILAPLQTAIAIYMGLIRAKQVSNTSKMGRLLTRQ